MALRNKETIVPGDLQCLNHRSCESFLLIPPPLGSPRPTIITTEHHSWEQTVEQTVFVSKRSKNGPKPFSVTKPSFPASSPFMFNVLSFLKSEGGRNGRFLPARSPARAFDRLCAPRALPEAGCGRRITPPHGHPRCLCNRCKRGSAGAGAHLCMCKQALHPGFREQ